MLLFNGMGSTCRRASHDGGQPHTVVCGLQSTPADAFAEAIMWSTLLHTSIDFGEKVRIYSKLKSRVATLVPKNVSTLTHMSLLVDMFVIILYVFFV